MTLTTAEIWLGGAIISVLSLFGGSAWVARKKVDKNFCTLQHNSLAQLFDAKLKPLDDGIKDIKSRLDKMNGK